MSFSYYFNFIIIVVFIVVALIGNGIVFIIFIGKDLRLQSTHRYLAYLAICDTIEVISSVIMNIPSITQNFTDALCKISFFLSFMFFQYCPYMKALVAIDRLITVKYSRRFAFKNTIKFQVLLIAIGFVFSFGTTVVYFIDYGKYEAWFAVFCDYFVVVFSD